MGQGWAQDVRRQPSTHATTTALSVGRMACSRSVQRQQRGSRSQGALACRHNAPPPPMPATNTSTPPTFSSTMAATATATTTDNITGTTRNTSIFVFRGAGRVHLNVGEGPSGGLSR